MKVFEEKKGNIFRILSEAISEGIIIVNDRQEIVSSNDASNKMFGYSAEELQAKNLNILIPNKYHNSHPGQVNEFIKTAHQRSMGHGGDLYGRRKDGSVFPLEAGLNPFEVYGSVYVMALITDITLRKKQQEQIMELNSSLEMKVAERTRELDATISKLKSEVAKRIQAEYKIKLSLRKERELNELKSKFLSLVSHEFKTPLSGILTSSILIGKYSQPEQREKREKHIRTIQNKVKYLNNILDDFLSIERLESGKATYKFNKFPLSKVVNEVIYNANMQLKEGQKISYPENIEDIVLDFDEKILELTLTNLINNAIKYSRENTTISVKVERRENLLAIHVSDQGRGIPEREQKYVFNKYFRAENVLMEQGTGIGLNIVKSHLENLGGTITFKSKENEGSTFTVQFPVEK